MSPYLRRRLIPVTAYMMATEELPKSLAEKMLPTNRMCGDTKRSLFAFRLSPDRRRLIFAARAKFRGGKVKKRRAGPRPGCDRAINSTKEKLMKSSTRQVTPGFVPLPAGEALRWNPIAKKTAAQLSDPAHRFHVAKGGYDTHGALAAGAMRQRTRGRRSGGWPTLDAIDLLRRTQCRVGFVPAGPFAAGWFVGAQLAGPSLAFLGLRPVFISLDAGFRRGSLRAAGAASEDWWTLPGSNRGPLVCDTSALTN